MPRQARLDVAGTLHHIMLRGRELVFLSADRQKGAANYQLSIQFYLTHSKASSYQSRTRDYSRKAL